MRLLKTNVIANSFQGEDKRLFFPKDSFSVKLNEQYWAVINSYSTSPVVVIHSDAREILDFFHSEKGGIIKDCLAKLSHIKDAKELVISLLKADLLFETIEPIVKFFDSKELSVWMHITNECNLRCRYCYVKKTSQNMSEEVARKTVEAVFRSAVKNSFKEVKLKLSGGEALLNFKLIKKVYAWAKLLSKKTGIDVRFVILTNGVVLNEKILKEIKDMDMEVMISLDGLEYYHDKQRVFANGKGSFKLVEKALKLVRSMGIRYYVSITISDENIEGLPELTKYLLDNRIYFFSFNFYRENPCSVTDEELGINEDRMVEYLKKSFKILEENLPKQSLLNILSDRTYLGFLHNKTCGVGANYLVINHLGKISKCQMEMDKVVANIDDDDPLERVISSPRGIQNLPVSEKEECRDCLWRYFCTGGCPLFTFNSTGRYDVKSPNCSLYKKLFPEIMRLEGLRLLKYGE